MSWRLSLSDQLITGVSSAVLAQLGNSAYWIPNNYVRYGEGGVSLQSLSLWGFVVSVCDDVLCVNLSPCWTRVVTSIMLTECFTAWLTSGPVLLKSTWLTLKNSYQSSSICLSSWRIRTISNWVSLLKDRVGSTLQLHCQSEKAGIPCLEERAWFSSVPGGWSMQARPHIHSPTPPHA